MQSLGATTLLKVLKDVEEKRMNVNDEFKDPEDENELTNLTIYAAVFGDEVILQKLDDEGLQLDAKGPIYKYPSGQILISNAIGAAACACNLKTLKYLVDKVPNQIEMNCSTKYGKYSFKAPERCENKPVHLVTMFGNRKERIECLQILLDANVKINSKDGHRQTVIHHAAHLGENDLLEFICQNTDIDIVALRNDGKTAEQICKDKNNSEGVKILQKKNKQNKKLAWLQREEEVTYKREQKALQKKQNKQNKKLQQEENPDFFDKKEVKILNESDSINPHDQESNISENILQSTFNNKEDEKLIKEQQEEIKLKENDLNKAKDEAHQQKLYHDKLVQKQREEFVVVESANKKTIKDLQKRLNQLKSDLKENHRSKKVQNKKRQEEELRDFNKQAEQELNDFLQMQDQKHQQFQQQLTDKFKLLIDEEDQIHNDLLDQLGDFGQDQFVESEIVSNKSNGRQRIQSIVDSVYDKYGQKYNFQAALEVLKQVNEGRDTDKELDLHGQKVEFAKQIVEMTLYTQSREFQFTFQCGKGTHSSLQRENQLGPQVLQFIKRELDFEATMTDDGSIRVNRIQ